MKDHAKRYTYKLYAPVRNIIFSKHLYVNQSVVCSHLIMVTCFEVLHILRLDPNIYTSKSIITNRCAKHYSKQQTFLMTNMSDGLVDIMPSSLVGYSVASVL